MTILKKITYNIQLNIIVTILKLNAATDEVKRKRDLQWVTVALMMVKNTQESICNAIFQLNWG